MIDYLLKFPNQNIAIQFGIANGFAALNANGEAQISLASHEHALHVIGEHNGSDWWVLFRDLVGIPIPTGGDQFIYWSSEWTVDDEDGNPVPVPRPISDDVPNTFWA
jgi:hypothetical protein